MAVAGIQIRMGNAPSVTGPDRGRSHVTTDVDSDDSPVGHRPVRSGIDDQEAELADRQNTGKSNRKSSDLNVPELPLSHNGALQRGAPMS